MNDLAKILYEKFFMRDLLGKILPALVMTISLLSSMGIHDFSKIKIIQEIKPLLWVLALGWGIVIGTSLQIIGELLGLHSASPRPNWVFFIPTKGNWRKVNEDFKERLTLIKNATDEKWSGGAKEQRERYVYLKEGSGNLALALIVSFSCLIIKGVSFFPIPLMTLIFSVSLYISHLIYAERQASFEIITLQKSGLLTMEEADKMKERYKSKK